MKKQILILSLFLTIGALIIGATGAYFSDVEKSAENTFTTGSIDIEINDTENWSQNFTWENMAPGKCKDFDLNIKNTGKSDLKVWKSINCLVANENGIVNAEQKWYDDNPSQSPKNNLQDYIAYEMTVDGNNVINRETDIVLNQIADYYVNLKKLDSGLTPPESGILKPGEEINISETYCLQEKVGSWAQTDKLYFNISVEANQVDAPEPVQQWMTIENKDTGGDWSIIKDQKIGLLKYDSQAPEFNYDFYGTGLSADEQCLIYSKDPWPNKTYLIDRGYPNSNGILSLNGSKDLGNLPYEDDDNYPDGAKIWLINCNNYAGDGSDVAWSPSDWLFDNWPGFINYKKGERPIINSECSSNPSNDNQVQTKTISLTSKNASNHFGDQDYNYNQADVDFTYQTPANNKLSGTIQATGLQPSTTYQLKFIGKPTCEYGNNGDDDANEYIGYKGRWTCLDCACSGAGCNRTDTQYENNTSECIGGYLVWGFFTTDENGNANKAVTTNNSHHVLRCGNGDSDLENSDCSGTNPIYPYCQTGDVLGELERPIDIPLNSLTFDSGNYDLELVLTEESFHTDCAGTWTVVMGGNIEFEVN